MRSLIFGLVLLSGAAGRGRADEAEDPRAAMKQAAIEQAETTPPPPPVEASAVAKQRAEAVRAANAAAHRAAVNAAHEAARGATPPEPPITTGPSRTADARGAAQDANQRGAASVARDNAVRNGRGHGSGHP
jgi:hypothetical protein